MGRFPFLLSLYRGLSPALGPFIPLFLRRRLQRGKEDGARLNERLGLPNAFRPPGRLAWLHGASVGEGLALLPLIDRLIARGFSVMVTTGTVTSAAILAQRLPAGAFHQYVPVDVPKFMRRFLRYWRPDIVMVAESEVWPNMFVEVHKRGVPLVLVNARLSARSYTRWQKAPASIGALLSRVDLCLAQAQDDASRLIRLGAPRVHVSGNLKYDVAPPPADSAALATLSGQIGARPVWIAASTHDGEEDIAMEVQRALMQRFPTLLTIVAPRHPNRGPEIAERARALGLNTALRSAQMPIDRDVQFYVADTMGELGLFFRLSSVIFVGKSLVGHGGQNPIEPAKLGSAILHGPNVENFTEVYSVLDDSKGAAIVADTDTLTRALGVLFSDAARLRQMARASHDCVEKLGGASDQIMAAVEPYFVQMAVDRRSVSS